MWLPDKLFIFQSKPISFDVSLCQIALNFWEGKLGPWMKLELVGKVGQ
jgi:hypothetical protein